MEQTAPRCPNLKTFGEFVSSYVYGTNFFNSLISIFVKHKLWQVESILHFIFHS